MPQLTTTEKAGYDTHVAAANPHAGHAVTTRSIATGAGLQGGGDLSADRTLSCVFGSNANEVCQGNDARLSDARTPTAHAASHKSAGGDPIRLDELAAPTADVSLNSNKVTSLADGTAPADAVNRGQLEDAPITVDAVANGTSYGFVLADAGKLKRLADANPITATIPTNASVPFPIGTNILIVPWGAGQITLAPAGGVTFRNGYATLKSAGQYKAMTALKVDTDEWLIGGDLATS